jgi:hypothetical protein
MEPPHLGFYGLVVACEAAVLAQVLTPGSHVKELG